MHAIEFSAVDKSYGDNHVLTGLDLEIRTGEVFALLGPNGAGKTTAVEIAEGYRRADGGTIRVLGVDPADAGPGFRAAIGIVLQHTTAFERSTVAETIEMFAALYPDPMSTSAAIDLVDLGPQRDQIADTMSGGQRRRLEVACGLVGRPRLLFLDEPTTGLDPEARRGMWDIIAGLRDGGTTVILTTHYLDEAEALADRIGILLDGKLDEVAEPDRIGRRDHALATVKFLVPDDLDPAQVTDLPPEAIRHGSHIVVETDRPDRMVVELANRFGRLDELTVTRPSLEDVYLAKVAGAKTGVNR